MIIGVKSVVWHLDRQGAHFGSGPAHHKLELQFWKISRGHAIYFHQWSRSSHASITSIEQLQILYLFVQTGQHYLVLLPQESHVVLQLRHFSGCRICRRSQPQLVLGKVIQLIHLLEHP